MDFGKFSAILSTSFLPAPGGLPNYVPPVFAPPLLMSCQRGPSGGILVATGAGTHQENQDSRRYCQRLVYTRVQGSCTQLFESIVSLLLSEQY